jgi:signal transduction histidine kinase
MRQLLHELKTPVNAIQGFAEVIQQQLFGPTPHEYRALALDGGQADFAAIVTGLARQLDEVLQSRGAGFRIETDGTPCPVPLSLHEAEALGWRLLATITGATGANEDIALRLTCDTATVRLVCSIPAALRAQDDVFAAESRAGGGAVSAGMFGAGFALRLARAEARAAGGDLLSEGDTLVLTLPRLTAA